MIIEQGLITDITHNAHKEQVIAVSTAIKTTCGSEVKIDGQEYLILSESDIFGVIES